MVADVYHLYFQKPLYAQYWSSHFPGIEYIVTCSYTTAVCVKPGSVLGAVSSPSQQTNVQTPGRMPKGVTQETFKAPALHINKHLLLSDLHTHTHIQRLAADSPLSPTPQRLPITKVVINSTVFPSRGIDFNDTPCLCTWQPLEHKQGSSQPALSASITRQIIEISTIDSAAGAGLLRT